MKEHLGYWNEKPGCFKRCLWIPAGLEEVAFGPLEPLQRAVGLPAFLSREIVRGSSCSLNHSGEKAKHELGWTYRSAREMWHGIIDGDIDLLARRSNRSLIARLKPMEAEDQ